MRVTPSHLRGMHYRWSDAETEWDHEEWAQPFARDRGEEMVALLQKAANALHLSEPADLHTIEEMLISVLPPGGISRYDALLWVYMEYKRRSYRGS